MKARTLAVVCAAAVAAVAVMARADGLGFVLHEYVPPVPNESLSLVAPGSAAEASSTTVDTPSGAIAPPDLDRSPAPESVYGRATDGASSTFRPDRDTRRPDHESYEDPFSPQLTPFKRMTAFDAVRDDYSLYVREPALEPVHPSGGVADGDDRFFGDLSVDLRAGEAVRIPTVAASARALRLTTSPVVPVELLRDGADNWFVRGRSNERVRLVLDLVAPRESFEADYPDISWRSLPVVPSQPSVHAAAFERVARAVGLSRQLRPREVVTKLTEYFRSFAPSDEPPPAGADVYLDLALSKKGVCRHRAFAFLVTALNAGVPARLVSNEAHAWVEVRDDRLWRRIDLGGAALDLQQTARLDRPQHVPPPDAFAWPTGRDGGADLGARERRDAEERSARRSPTTPDVTGTPARAANDPSALAQSTASAIDAGSPVDGRAPSSSPHDGKPDTRPPARVTVDDVDKDLFRGRPMRLRGNISAGGEPCARVRVDVLIASVADGERHVGSLATDERGNYEGQVGLPSDLTVGDYELYVATPGNARCGAARSE